MELDDHTLSHGFHSPRTMFFEVASGGHRLDYIQLLLAALAECRVMGSTVFVLGPDFAHGLPDGLVGHARRTNQVEILYLAEDEVRRCQSKSGLLRRLNTYLILQRYLDATNASSGFVNYLDTVLAGLAVPFPGRSEIPIAGILFRPDLHYPSLGSPQGRPAQPAKRIRKWLLGKLDDLTYRGALKNPRVRTVLSLDPFFPLYAREHYEGGHKVAALPEPYSGSESPVAASRGRDSDRITFLLFGSITERKGILDVLEALTFLSDEEAGRMRLVIAGRVDHDIKAEVLKMADGLLHSHPDAQFEIRDHFIPNQELEELVTDSDVILAPYRKHIGSSGVLAWAASHRRPVISQAYGLMGALVNRYGLGLVCDPEDHEDLAEAFRIVIRDSPTSAGDISGMDEYAAANGRQLFVDAVLRAADLATDSSQDLTT